MKKILIDDSLITGGRPSAMQDPNWHEINKYFEFSFGNKTFLVHNVDVYWTDESEIIEKLIKHSKTVLSINGAYSTLGNGIVAVNNGLNKDSKIEIQIHAY